MNFPKFLELPGKLRQTLLPNHSRVRSGSPADRGKVLPWPGSASQAMHAVAVPAGKLGRLAPGLVTGAADVDPALVLTATVIGASFGYQLLWVVVLCVPFLLNVFAVAARIGHETRRGLVELVSRNYGKPLAIGIALLIVVINFAMVVADLLAVSDALSIILDQRRVFFVALVAFSVWYILIFRDYQKITQALAFLALPLFVYVFAAFAAGADAKTVAYHALVPSVGRNSASVQAVIALMGSLLTPYVLIWQTSSRREQQHDPHEDEHRMGTLVSTLLCFSIIVAAATVLPRLAGEETLTTRLAAEALAPAVGDLGEVLFALGIIGAGMVALPVLVASLCYALSEAMGWEYGLSQNPWDAKRFYVLISASLFIAATLNFFRIDPVKALYWSQILAGGLTIPVLAFILLLSNDRRVMRTVNTHRQNFWIGGAAGGLTAAGLMALWFSLRS
jgi:Mn2+/Fe2+ NRAMP family transporter